MHVNLSITLKRTYMMKKILILLFFTYFSIGYAQDIGDYQSKGTGNWNTSGTWEVWDGTAWRTLTSGYPGTTTIPAGNGSSTVTIVGCHEITVDVGKNNDFTYDNIGKLVVNGRMILLKQNDVRFGAALQEVIIDGGSIFWSDNPTNLYLPQNCLITLLNLNSIACSFPKGLQPIANCTGSQNLYIGATKPYSSCNGGNNTGGSFQQVNNVGGTNFAALPLTNPSAVCLNDNKPIQFNGSIIKYVPGAVGTLTYEWKLIEAPLGSGYSFTTANSQSVNIGTLTTPGDYTFELTVASASLPFRNSRKFVISVDGSTSYNGVFWDNGIPSEGNHRHAVISSPYVTALQGEFSACSCTVNAGQKLTVSADTTVNLVGKLTNKGNAENVVIESDGNLIQKLNVPNTSAVTVQRYVTDMDNVLNGPGAQMDYVFWSSPVLGQNLQAFSPGTKSNRIYQYNEANDLFTQASGDFAPGKGYAIQAETSEGYSPNTTGYNKTYEFKGVPNNGDVPILIKRSSNTGVGGTVIHGYNLVGNPYPSNISFDELYNLNADLINPTVWFWTNKIYTPNQQGSSYDGSNYVAYTKGGSNNPGVNGIIKVGQGFIIQKTNLGDGTFTFKNMNGTAPVRVADAGTFYQRGTMNRYWLALTSPDEISNTQLIGYFDGAADGYDGIYDAKALAITPDLFYSVVDDQRLLVQGKAPVFRPEDRVALGANLYREGNYTITLQQPEGIFAGRQAVYLKDHETGRMTNLSEQPYTFAAKAGMSEGRFEVLYQPQATPVASQSAKDGVIVYRDGTRYVIKSRETISLIEVYDGAGRMVHTERPGREEVSINTEHYPKGVFFLKIHTGGSVITKKMLH